MIPGKIPGTPPASGMGLQVNPGGQTIATFVDTVPPPPTTGFLQICKIAGSGVTVGTNFTFSVAGTPITVAAGPPITGTCGPALTVPAGQVLIAPAETPHKFSTGPGGYEAVHIHASPRFVTDWLE